MPPNLKIKKKIICEENKLNHISLLSRFDNCELLFFFHSENTEESEVIA